MRATVLGAGSWGTALGLVLADNGHTVTMWDIDTAVLDTIRHQHENTRYLPGHPLPDLLTSAAEIAVALDGAELVVIAVPSPVVRVVADQAAGHLRQGTWICCVAKGVETDTLMTMNEVLEDVLPVPMQPYLSFLSGPSFAKEVAERMPTAVTVAARWEHAARQVQDAFASPTFRPYTATDVMGVEIGGCVKNVIAIAAGVAEGLGYGANARAALITRGLAEISRLAVARGANPLTLDGLAGMGDLMLTCSSVLSRNFRVGLGLGQGKDLARVQAELGQVAEGVVNARSTVAMAGRWTVDMPISHIVHDLLYAGLSPTEAAHLLMTRAMKPERY